MPADEAALVCASCSREVLDGRNAAAAGRRAARAGPRAARTSASTRAPRPPRGRGHDPARATRIENPVTGERFTFIAHRRQHRRRAARVRLRAAARRQGPDPARAPDPDRALRGHLRLRALPARPARPSSRGPGEVVEAPPGVAHGFGNAGEGEARMRVEVRPALAMEDMFAEVVALAEAGKMTRRGLPAQPAHARLARAPLRPGGARAAAHRRRPAAPARPAGVARLTRRRSGSSTVRRMCS